MATHDRQPARPLSERLYQEPQAFEFAQAVMLLERMRPHAAALGTGYDPRHEAVRLRGPLAPVFAPSALSRLEPPQGEHPPVLSVQLFGLGGPDGPLPYAYQEWLQQRILRKDHSAAEFLDLFQHRLLGQLYRTQCKYRIAPTFARPAQSPAFPLLRALIGLMPKPLQERQTIPDAALLARTALAANQRRSAAGFEMLLRGHFAVPARVDEFDGGWRDIPSASRSSIGINGRNARLGQSAIAGTRVWDEHAAIRITLGPLPLARYQDFLPGGHSYTQLHALAAFYFGPDLRCNLSLRLAENQMPAPQLSRAAPMKLGWTSWLKQSDGSAPVRQMNTILCSQEGHA